MARNESIHIAVRKDIKDRFQTIANEYGLTMSALASFIIGQWVYQQEKIIQPMISDIREAGVRALSEAMRQE